MSSHTPQPEAALATDVPPPTVDDPTDVAAAPPPVDPRETIPPIRRLRQVVSIALIIAGLALLIVTLRAQDLGLASTSGASWTQVTTGIVGTVLLVTGLALIVQAFEESDEPSDDG